MSLAAVSSQELPCWGTKHATHGTPQGAILAEVEIGGVKFPKSKVWAQLVRADGWVPRAVWMGNVSD